jgi:hypothetical protein
MTEQTTTRKPEIRLSQLIAAALAAITAAFLGSRLGTAGTVIGAGVASLVSTVAGALYQHSLDRTSRTVRSRVGHARPDDPAVPASADDTGLVQPPVTRARRPRWVVVVALTAVAFVIGMGAVTGVELLKNGPISGGDNGTTVGSLFGQPTRSTSTAPPTTTPSTTTTTTQPTTTIPTTTPTTTTAPPTSTTTPTTTAPPSLTTSP